MEITLKPKNQENPVPDDVWIYDGEILRSLNEQRLDLVWIVKDGVATPKHAKDDKHTWLFTATRIEPKEFRLDDVWEYKNGIVEPKILYSHSRRYSFDGIEFKELKNPCERWIYVSSEPVQFMLMMIARRHISWRAPVELTLGKQNRAEPGS